MTKYLVLFCVALTIALAISVKTCRDQTAEKTRYKDNQNALMHKARSYKASDSLNAVSVERLLLTKHELEQERGNLVKTIGSLNLKLRRVNSVSTTAIQNDYSIRKTVRDSIIHEAGKTDTLRCIDYCDRWLTFSGCSNGNDFTGAIESRDTLQQIVHRVPHKFWFIKYGTKAIRQEAISRNPHSKITFQEYIELTK